MTRRLATVLLAAAAALGGLSAHAGPVEEQFRGFIDQLRRAGERIAAFQPGLVGRQVQPFIMDRVDRLPLASLTVVVFVSDRCPSCREAVEDARRIASVQVEVMDVSASGTAREAFAITRAPGLPATMAGSQILIGRDPNLLKALAGRAGMVDSNDQGNKP